ncbi:organic solvent tolerance protein [Bdellovibrio svalbardensis]|uniref:Organic solvent tolerance protein n=1 Tax=Bdellovibrio svalbardensis TaxID=2972972 RepID=A0ABT6DQE8_9BACT|nr:organic solvent tolerance protein [Bdellovibrio svalbardensis]MDG0818285.1 organic solvent tolerance protein [Bdellovibrio svalbardensis]
MLKKSALVLAVLACTSVVQAKELTNRLGVGVKSHETLDLPELAVVYNPTRDIAVTGGLGIDTKKDASKFAANAGVRRIVFKEDNMNFYMGGTFGFVNYEVSGATSTTKESGIELDAVFGGEFFLPGLDSLGFTFEGGAGVISTSNVRFRTIADSPLRAGIIFYF